MAGPMPAIAPEPEPEPERDPIEWLKKSVEEGIVEAKVKARGRKPGPSQEQRWLWLMENLPPKRGGSGRARHSPPDPRPIRFKVDELEKMCEEVGLLDDKVDLLIRDLDHKDGSGGVDIGYRGPRDLTVDVSDKVNERLIRLCCCSKTMTAAESDQKVAEVQAWLKASALADAKMGRVLGPFKRDEIPFKNYRVSPRFAVPKPGSAKWRPIHHLSYPRVARKNGVLGVNQYITRGWSEELSSVEDVIADVLLVKSMGAAPRLALSDVSAAFRQIPVRREDQCLLGYRCGDDYFFEQFLPFGLSSSMEIYCKVGNLISAVGRRKAEPWLCQGQPTVSVRGRTRYDDPWWKEKPRVRKYKGVHTYVDDNQMVTSERLIHGLAEVNAKVYERAGMPLCPKKALEGAAGKVVQRVLGKDIDCDKMTVATPADKQAAMLLEINDFNRRFKRRRRRPCQQELLQLVGRLHSVSRTVAGAHGFMQEMNRVAHSVQELHHHVRLTEAFWMELDFFQMLLTQHNGVSLMHKYQDREPRWFLATDASGFGVGPQLTSELPDFPRYLPAKLRPSGTNFPKRGHSEWQFWRTLFRRAVSAVGKYTTRVPSLDCFACNGNHLCDLYFTERQNALLRDIAGWFVWANPPYHLWPTVAAWLLDASARDGRTGAMFVMPDYAMEACSDLIDASVELMRLPAGSPGFIKHADGRPLFVTPAPLRWDATVRVLLPWDDSLTSEGKAAMTKSLQARAGGYGGWLADAATKEIRYFEGTWPVEAAGIPIHGLENVAYWVAVQEWSRLWGSDHVFMANDNQAVLAVASRHRAKNPTLRLYGQAGALLESRADWTMDKGYVRSKDNYYADGLSRGDHRSVVAELGSLGYSLTRDDVTHLISDNIAITSRSRADERGERPLRKRVAAMGDGARRQRPRTDGVLPAVCPPIVVQQTGPRATAVGVFGGDDAGTLPLGNIAPHTADLRNGPEGVAAILRLVRS